MLHLSKVLQNYLNYNKLHIFGAGGSIRKYNLTSILDKESILIFINYADVIQGLTSINDIPIFFFAHDLDSAPEIILTQKNQELFQKENTCVFLRDHLKFNDSERQYGYPPEHLQYFKNLYYYSCQCNFNDFEKTDNSLWGHSSSVHSPMTFPIGNDHILEIYFYGLDSYVYRNNSRYDSNRFEYVQSPIIDGHFQGITYLNSRRPDLKIYFCH